MPRKADTDVGQRSEEEGGKRPLTRAALSVPPLKMRQLTKPEIDTLASRAKVKATAVKNFLGTLDGVTEGQAYANLREDARSYQWNAPTVAAITTGIRAAAGKATIKVKQPA